MTDSNIIAPEVFTIQELNSNEKVIAEHIFVGGLLEETLIKSLNSGRKDPSNKDVRGFFQQFNVKFDRERSIQKYYPILLERSDTISTLYYKINRETKLDGLYLWSDRVDGPLSHRFNYMGREIKLNANPFKRGLTLDRLFVAYGNLILNNRTGNLLRNMIKDDDRVINMISRKNLDSLAKGYDDVEPRIIISRFIPPELENIFANEPYFNIEEAQCMNELLRDPRLPVELKGGDEVRINWKNVEIESSQIEQCTIHVKVDENKEPFINLETVFQLMPMEGDFIFVKMKRGDRSISKISNKVQRFKNQVTRDMLTEWANIEEHHRGLMYRKMKSSMGLVIYRIYENGFIEIQMNWTDISKNINLQSQLGEIKDEIKKLNSFIKQINQLNFQLPEKENNMIDYADPNFFDNPESKTRFIYFNFKTVIDTNKQQVSWNALNYLIDSFPYYFLPIHSWRVFNLNELRKLTTGLTESNIFYVRSDDNIIPDPLTGVIYALGLVGNIDKEQTVSVDRQKDLILEFKNAIYGREGVDLDKEMLEDRIRMLKDGNPGVLMNLKYTSDRYVLNVKGAHGLAEIKEINFLIDRMLKFYFHIGVVYKYIKDYSCSSLKWILANKEKIDIKQLKSGETGRQDTKRAVSAQDDVEDIFNIGESLDDDILIPDAPMVGIEETTQMVGEIMIPGDIKDLAEIEEIKSGERKVKGALDYLKDVSKIFQTEYRRLGCTANHPVVISIKDFWRNYGRLTKRFQELKSKLSAKEQENYKERYQKELESGDQSLDKYRKRVSWVSKRLSGIDKTVTEEIADIFDRYDKGAQLKVPLDKNMTKFSEEYFYFCPRNWCYFCRESRLSDEIEKDKKGDQCRICQNKLYSINIKNTFIGFPDSKRHNHINCLPCCFKNKSKFDKKRVTCKVNHPTKKISREIKKVQTDVNHILTGDIIPIGRIGYLDSTPEGILNNFFNGGQVVDKIKNNQSIFVKKGVNNVGERDAFLEALSYFKYANETKKTPDELRQLIIDAMDMATFLQLNNGLIYSIFKTKENDNFQALDEFKRYLETEYLNEEIIWHLTSFPGFLTSEGFNLLIIKRSMSADNKNHKYTMACPTGLAMDDYFNKNKYTGIILKLENNMYYPITLVSCEIDFGNIIQCTREIQDYLFFTYNELVVRKLLDHAIAKCSLANNPFEKDRLDFYQTLDELDKTPYLNRDEGLTIVMNYYNQIIFIKLKMDNGRILLLPVKSTPPPTFTVSDIFEEFGGKIKVAWYDPPAKNELVTYKQLKQIIKNLQSKTKIPLSYKYYVMNFNDQVYGVKLDNGLVLMFDETPVKMFKSGDELKIIEEESNDVDISIYQFEKKELDQRQSYVNKTTFQKESYQRLRFELSRLIPKRTQVKQDIVEILTKKATVTDKRKALEKIIANLIKEIAIIKQPDLKEYKLPQIRSTCATTDNCNDPHCHRSGGKCLVILPDELILPNDTIKENTIERYVVLIADEILRNAVKRSELLDGKVSIYVNPSQMVYDVSKEMLINDPGYEAQITNLFARSVNYLDLLDKHYFINESEVFTREVDRYLFYFPEDSWYKNTGLSKNDFVMNNRNIYDLLNEVLGEDVGEQMWNFIDKHNWRLWLNALRQESPDEYENIYQKSQFMEHIKYGKSTLTKIHIGLISRLQNIKMILMNRNAIGNRKFHCLGTTQASSSSKTYLILYKYEDDYYLVGRTPHLDLSKTDDVVYVFKESKIPQKFFKMWYDHCPEDHKIQNKPDPADALIKEIPVSDEIKQFIDDLDEGATAPKTMIDEVSVLEPPSELGERREVPDFLKDLGEDKRLKESEPNVQLKRRKPAAKKSPPKLKLKKRSRSVSKKREKSPPKLVLKRKIGKTTEPPHLRLKKQSRSTSRGRKISRKDSRSTSRGRKASRKASRSTSRGRKVSRSTSRGRRVSRSTSRGKKLTFKKRK